MSVTMSSYFLPIWFPSLSQRHPHYRRKPSTIVGKFKRTLVRCDDRLDQGQPQSGTGDGLAARRPEKSLGEAFPVLGSDTRAAIAYGQLRRPALDPQVGVHL